MKKSNELLNLEKRLENNTQHEIILNKFKFNKPDISNQNTGNNDFLTNIGRFINELKKSNDEILNDPEKSKNLDIEDCKVKKNRKYIEMNLGLGVLEVKKDENDLLGNVIHTKNDDIQVDLGDKELIEFLYGKDKRKRIHKIKKK
jgi:hypothetical protein